MAANTLLITKAYRDGLDWTEAIMDGIRSDLQSWGQDAVDNLNQIRLDVFGSSYAYDNDGVANNTNPMNVQQTITPTATITALDFVSTATTTGTIIDISDLDAITTGRGISLISNSTSAGTRQLFQLTNDNTAATGCTPLQIQQDAANRAAYIQQTANSGVLFLDKDGTGSGECLLVDNEGTGRAADFDTLGNAAEHVRIVMGAATSTGDGLHINAVEAASANYDFMTGFSGNDADVEIRLRGNGEVSGDAAAYVSPAADYAEMFECVDKEGIEPGYFVTLEKLTGKIRKATDKDEYILGVVSGKPAVVADTDWNRWAHKYLYNDWNQYLLDENGHRIVNPKYNPKYGHATRMERPEWAAVGMLGKLNVRAAEDITKEFVDINAKGMAVNGTTFRVLQVVRQKSKDPDKKGYGLIKIVFRGKED